MQELRKFSFDRRSREHIISDGIRKTNSYCLHFPTGKVAITKNRQTFSRRKIQVE